MSVILCRSAHARDPRWAALPWVVIGAARPALDPTLAKPGVAAALVAAFDVIAPHWLGLARSLATMSGGHLSQAAVCAANVSDFGEALAWTHLVGTWARDTTATLVVCDDPWLARRFEDISGVDVGDLPALGPVTFRRGLRGMAARLVASLRFAAAAVRGRRHRPTGSVGGTSILVYGHPASRADGYDAYFGRLMLEMPGVRRVFHVDCPIAVAGILGSPSLHAFGNPFVALSLAFACWRLDAGRPKDDDARLIARAVTQEGAGAQAAAIAWQIHCQARWLDVSRPAIVAWPWEGHAWERALIRLCRARGIRTVGYQHSVVGRQMLNYASGFDATGTGELPDTVLTTGMAWRDRLIQMRLPAERLRIGGAWRSLADDSGAGFDPEGDVFVALPFDSVIAAEMIEACGTVAADGAIRFAIKDHPMSPFAFDEMPGLYRTVRGLGDFGACRAVVYAATSVGIEALLAGIPTVRFLCSRRLAMDIMPDGVEPLTCDASGLGAALAEALPSAKPDRVRIFAPVDLALWATIIDSGRDEKVS